MSSFIKFLSSLQNPEKTRDFNKFKNYNLEDFEAQLTKIQSLRKRNEKYNPFRISVVGTNGKGSTSFYLAELLRMSYPSANVGLYTSPHLITPRERIVCNGQAITTAQADELVLELTQMALDSLQGLSYFEFLTSLTFSFFERKECAYEIWEAGLGGRLDATKLANPEIIVLTKIGMDHCEILGNTLEAIAREKIHLAGTNTKCIYSFPVAEPLRSSITQIADGLNIPVKFFKDEPQSSYLETNFDFSKWVLQDLGKLNEISKITFSQFPRPLGRLELLCESPKVIFDPAHNPDAVGHTLKYVRSQAGWNSANLLLACLPDKDMENIWNEVVSHGWNQIWFYEAEGFVKWPKDVITKFGVRLNNPEDLAREWRMNKLPCLAVGSFRLYPILTSLFQKDVIL
jgi:dihydrofolate synthase/folylpolyglutamate synthase